MTEYGLQLYSIRDCMKEDMEKSVAKVAQLGYAAVEPAGFFGRTAEEVKAMLAENGLKLSGTHSSWLDLRDNFDETLAYHKALGNTRYVIPWGDFQTEAKIAEFCDFVNAVQPKLAAEGISLHYHNHCHEFVPNEEGLIPYDELIKRTNIGLEVDVYWAYRAGKDPLELIQKLSDRISVIHVKDGTMERGLSLGLGTVDIAGIVAWAKANGVDMVVESEDQEPDGISEVRRCIEYLKTLE